MTQLLMTDSDIYIARFNELALAVHDYGAKVAVQLTAGMGRVASCALLKERGAVAPSALPCAYDPSVTARELSTAEIERLIQPFQFAAERLVTAEIDGVELHAHGGYLFDQFLTALWNRRTDKYGGDLNGRLRFSLEVIEAIRKGAGIDFPIIYRFALDHYLEGGREAEEGLEIARRLEAAGVDALHIDAGCVESREWTLPTPYHSPGFIVNLGEMVKKVVKIPVIIVGKLGYPDLAERVLQEGKADFIALGRALLADPEWPNKVKEGRLKDIRPCIGDNEGCSSRWRASKYISCAVNPMTGMEQQLAIRPAEKRRTVFVVGGGPAGMEAARVAALRGHRVTLWEKGSLLGGNLIAASVPEFKREYRDLIEYLSWQIKKLGVKIELGKEATPELIEKMKPEVVFVATGSTPIFIEVPGAGRDKIVTAVDLLLGKKEAGKSVVVIGSGIVGCETALHLSQNGKNLTIVARSDRLARDVNVVNRAHLLKLLTNTRILVNTKVLETTNKGIIVLDKNGKRDTIEADTVVLAVGFKPDRALLESLKDTVPEIYAIGDCVEPRKVINAIWDGFRSARLV